MPDVKVTIDGITGTVPAASTVLEAAEHLGIEIPTLCHHPAIKPIGACRICLVEIEKQRVLQPACTFPVSDGMVVHTKSQQVIDSRRFVLQLLFSERNHFCMFCQMSGSCELQSLGYEYGLDHWEFDRPYPKYEVDASRKYFVMDPDRCILCRRCVRVCDELVGNNTLGLKHRGAETMIMADLDVPFGESSCVSCGTCLQVCPTGALMDRASAYMGATDEIARVKSRCTACSVGCGLELVVRDNRVIRVEGDWDAAPNKGLLCEIGRFALLHEERQRVYEPLVRTDIGLTPASWETALETVSDKFGAANGKLMSVVSGYATTEAARTIVERFPGDKVAMEGAPTAEANADFAALDEADCFIIVGVDLTVNYQVAGFAVKRSRRHRRVPLFVIDDKENGFDSWASAKLSPDNPGKAIKVAVQAEAPVIICDAASYTKATDLAKSLPKAKVVSFGPGGNSAGLSSAGVQTAFKENDARAYYVLAGEAAKVDDALLKALRNADFVVVQASFREPWESVADVILPSPIMHEKGGTIVNAEGRVTELVAAVSNGLPSETEVIERLSAAL